MKECPVHAPDPTTPVLLRPLGVADATRESWGAAVLLEPVAGRELAWTVLATGSSQEVSHHPAASYARPVDRPGSVLIPGLVNAHTHLDLTHIGPREHDPGLGFIPWVDMIRAERRHGDEEIVESVRRGIELSLAGGTVAVGDIAGAPGGRLTLAPWRELNASPLRGVSFIEFFAIGAARERARRRIEESLDDWAALNREAAQSGRAVIGLQPHAPNTVDRRVYRWAAEVAATRGFRISTHLAETPEEREFVAAGTGAQRELLERLGAWDESVMQEVGRGLHPVHHLEEVLASARFLVAHANDAPEGTVELLARTGASVAYCPHASEYFGAARHFGEHRYRDMLDAGVNVCIGTDSLVNLPARCGDPSVGVSVLNEMRLLHRRDQAGSGRLIEMATVNGARALGLEESLFRFEVGREIAGVLEVDVGPESGSTPLQAVLRSIAPGRLLRHEDLASI